MFFKDKKDAEFVKQFIENRNSKKSLNVHVKKGGTVSKEHYITFNGKVLTEERLVKELDIKRKELGAV